MAKNVVNIRGKEYETIASRVARFRDDHPDHTIETQLIHHDDERVIMKALIMDGDKLLATGYAEEVRASSNINATSALENCETSAIGRALAAYKYAGTEYASADEVAHAISQQEVQKATERLKQHNLAWIRHEASLISIRAHCHEENYSAAWEEWMEIPQEDQMALKVAPTKGGWMDQVTKKGLEQGAKDDFDPETGKYRSIAERNAANA